MSSNAVEQIKAKLNIVDLVGSYLKLEKAGINWKARCPFHQERTPSFFVSPARQSYHCFGCQKGGDLISFVEEIEGLDFLGALKILAERSGFKLERDNFQRDPTLDRIYQVLAAAARYYEAQLTRAGAVLAYLAERGLTEETIKQFALGWAPPEWRGLFGHLREQGWTPEDLERAGLAIRVTARTGEQREGGWYDRFRGRIIFPLFDSAGRVVGFSGRVFGEAPENVGKYVNSPETAVYHKSKLLYGLHRAKLPIRQNDAAVLVEGQLDLILSHQSGVGQAVAVSGTALTEEHLLALSRLTKNLIFAFDSDGAGWRAAARAIEMALALGLEVRVALLPTGEDPASVCRREPAVWQKAVGEAKHVIDFLLAVVSARESDRRRRAHAIKAEVYPYVARLTERIDQAHFIGKISALTGLPEEVIRADLNAIPPPRRDGAPTPPMADVGVAPTRADRLLDRLAGLATACLHTDPAARPEMGEIASHLDALGR